VCCAEDDGDGAQIDPIVFRIWLNILKQVPNGVLWLLRFPAAGEPHLKRTAAQWAGEEVASRVIFTDVASVRRSSLYARQLCDSSRRNRCTSSAGALPTFSSMRPNAAPTQPVPSTCQLGMV
jgi:hypothetical protein